LLILNLKSKYRIFFLFFLFINLAIYSQEKPLYTYNFDILSFGIGGNFPVNDDYDSETYMTLLNIGMESTKTGIGINFSPINVRGWVTDSNNEPERIDENMSIFNLTLHWNVLNVLTDKSEFQFGMLGLLYHKFYLGPFVSVNYLFLKDYIHWDRYKFKLGIQGGIRSGIGNIWCNAVYANFGYHIIDGTSKFFIGVQFDILLPFLIIPLLEM